MRIDGHYARYLTADRRCICIVQFAIILHYTFTYAALSSTGGSKTAILKQIGALFYVCLSFLFFKEEKFSVKKIIGALMGLLGIVAINFDFKSVSFTSIYVFIPNLFQYCQ